ncbi:MAG: ABC transporter ATP-binding protein [Acidobacteriota bacterium]
MDIRLNNVNKKLGDFYLKNLNIRICDGEYFVLLGPSGSGKTKTIELIAGLSDPDSGSISGVEGKQTGLIYQDYMLFPHLNVYENISYGLRFRDLRKDEIRRKVENVAAEFGISHLLHKKIEMLSGGEKQRTAIARATILSPDIYIFDEPTSALDRTLKEMTRSLFRKFHKRTGKTFIHVTHDFEEAISLADKIGIIFDGEIVQTGTPDEIFTSPTSKNVADFLGYKNVIKGKVKKGVFSSDGVSIAVNGDDSSLTYIAVRSDDILLSEKEIDSSARNSFNGKVTDIYRRSAGVEVIVDVGLPLTVEITRKSFDDMNIKEGDRFWVTFKVSSVRVFPHDPDTRPGER